MKPKPFSLVSSNVPAPLLTMAAISAKYIYPTDTEIDFLEKTYLDVQNSCGTFITLLSNTYRLKIIASTAGYVSGERIIIPFHFLNFRHTGGNNQLLRRLFTTLLTNLDFFDCDSQYIELLLPTGERFSQQHRNYQRITKDFWIREMVPEMWHYLFTCHQFKKIFCGLR